MSSMIMSALLNHGLQPCLIDPGICGAIMNFSPFLTLVTG